jgi:transposase
MANRKLTINEQEIAALKQAADSTDGPAELKRLQAVRLYGTGHSVSEIAEIVDTSPTSIYRWATWYRQGGRAELQSKYKGNQNAAKLSRSQKAELRERLHQQRPPEVLPPDKRISQGQFWTVSDLKIAVKQWYGVTYQSHSSYRELFKACGFSVQRTAGQYRSQASQEDIADFEEQAEKK